MKNAFGSGRFPFLKTAGRSVVTGVIAGFFILLAGVILALPFDRLGAAVELAVGEPAPQDVLAPRDASFVSELLTEQARATAAAQIPDIYDPPDIRVARQQVLLLRDILAFASTVRADTLASADQKRADLAAIEGLALERETIDEILAFSDAQWTAVQNQALSVLEVVLRTSIRPDQVEALRRALPSRVTVEFSEPQVHVVTELVGPLVVPNSFYNDAATQAARQAARDSVAPVIQPIVRGQSIVVRGQIVTEVDVETLRALGLQSPEADWGRTVSSALAALVTGGLLAFYVYRFNPDVRRSPRLVLIFALAFDVVLLAAQLLVPGRTLLPYLVPAPALAMLLAVLGGPNLAITVSVAMGALVGYIGDNSLELTIYTAMGGLVAGIALGRAGRVNLFFWAGLASAIAQIGIILIFRLNNPATDPLGLLQLLAMALINGGVSAALTLVSFFLLGGVFDITTSLQLVELARPDHPLLQFVLRNAPGTYQHSLQVANLAEQAGEQIGANVMLIRVGALFHDAGKALNPHYFVENQLDGVNIHDQLPPADSATAIIRHVTDGLDLARRYRLPSSIRAFIAEHHGTLRTLYQYKLAVEAAGGDASQVDPAKFQYPGPRPRSRETALLMLADGCEAKARADRARSEEDIQRVVKAVIDDRLANGQLDDTAMTLSDLRVVRESFAKTLRGAGHVRVQYPELQPAPGETLAEPKG